MRITTTQARDITASIPTLVGHFPGRYRIAVIAVSAGAAQSLPVLIDYRPADGVDLASITSAVESVGGDTAMLVFITCEDIADQDAVPFSPEVTATVAGAVDALTASGVNIEAFIATGFSDADSIRRYDDTTAAAMIDFRDAAHELGSTTGTVCLSRDQAPYSLAFEKLPGARGPEVMEFSEDETIAELEAVFASPTVLSGHPDRSTSSTRDRLTVRTATLCHTNLAPMILDAILSAPAPAKASRYLMLMAASLGASPARALMLTLAATGYHFCGAGPEITDRIITAARQWSPAGEDVHPALTLAENRQWTDIAAPVTAG